MMAVLLMIICAAVSEFIISVWSQYPVSGRQAVFRCLRLVGVLATGIDFQFLEDLSTEAVARNHALYGKFNDAFRRTLTKSGWGVLMVTANVTGITVVNLLFLLATTQLYFFGINDNYKVACIRVWSENGLAFTA